MARDKQEKVELVVYVKHKTAQAMLCELWDEKDDDNAKSFWLPYSQIDIVDFNETTDRYKVTIPEWLAIQKNLV